jgi:N-acetylneuraminic acid mutarotase
MIRKHAWLLAFCAAVAACETPTESTTPDVTLEGVEPSASIINIWSTKASILSYRRFAAAGAQNNIIYVVGGRDALGDATKTLQVYTIATNSWAFKADLPVNRSSLNGANFLNGRLYVSGGQSNTGGAMKTLYSYNPNTNTWTKHKNLPVESACGAQGVIAGRLYVYTPGVGACGSTHGFYRYNPNNDTWTSLPTPPSVHLSPVGGVIAGKFHLVGGSANSTLSPNLQQHVYDPGSNSWGAKAWLPSKQQNATGAALNGFLWVAGGIDFTAPGVPPIANLRRWTSGGNLWSNMAPLPTPRFYAAGVNAGGKLWVISGNGAGGNSTKVEAYTP